MDRGVQGRLWAPRRGRRLDVGHRVDREPGGSPVRTRQQPSLRGSDEQRRRVLGIDRQSGGRGWHSGIGALPGGARGRAHPGSEQGRGDQPFRVVGREGQVSHRRVLGETFGGGLPGVAAIHGLEQRVLAPGVHVRSEPDVERARVERIGHDGPSELELLCRRAVDGGPGLAAVRRPVDAAEEVRQVDGVRVDRVERERGDLAVDRLPGVELAPALSRVVGAIDVDRAEPGGQGDRAREQDVGIDRADAEGRDVFGFDRRLEDAAVGRLEGPAAVRAAKDAAEAADVDHVGVVRVEGEGVERSERRLERVELLTPGRPVAAAVLAHQGRSARAEADDPVRVGGGDGEPVGPGEDGDAGERGLPGVVALFAEEVGGGGGVEHRRISRRGGDGRGRLADLRAEGDPADGGGRGGPEEGGEEEDREGGEGETRVVWRARGMAGL